MSHVTAAVNLSFEAAYFLMPHFHFEAILIEFEQAVFHRRAHSTMRTFPILLLHDLGSGHFFNRSFFERRLYPEFQFRSRSELNVYHIIAINAFETGNLGVFLERSEQFFFHIVQRVCQHCTRVNALALMYEEGGNTQSSHGLARFFIVKLHVVVHKPVNRRVNRHINLRVIQGGNTGQHHGRTIRLDCRTGIEIINILEENSYGYFFIRIVAGHIHTH